MRARLRIEIPFLIVERINKLRTDDNGARFGFILISHTHMACKINSITCFKLEMFPGVHYDYEFNFLRGTAYKHISVPNEFSSVLS